MLFLMIILLFTDSTWAVQSVGSVLFYKRNPADCWTQDELAKLRARKIFESVILPCRPPDKITAKYNKQVLRYFRSAIRAVENKNELHNAEILKVALADAIGGHLRSQFLPNLRFAYYAGYVPYNSAQQMHEFFDDVKAFYLNTQGLGWRAPDKIPLQSNLSVGKILIGPGKPFDPCEGLLIRRDENNCIHIPLPRVEDSYMPGALALPFKAGGFVSLTSPKSENILLKYYTTAARCILRSSPTECRHTDFVNFNNELWHWMKKHVAAHLMDEQLYAAYGGVLRIAAAVQNYGKGLSRRNLYEEEEFDNSNEKWHTFKTLMDKTMSFDADWTPPLALILVLGTALAICFLHIVYTYVLGRAGGCHCLKLREFTQDPYQSTQGLNYTNIDSTFPAVLPSHSGPKFNEHIKRGNRSSNQPKTASVGSERCDFNDNVDQVTSVVISDNQSELYTSSDVTEEEAGRKTLVGSVRTLAGISRQKTPRSPPKIEASVAQLKIDRKQKSPRRQSGRSRQRYSASTMTQSEATYCREISDTLWSDSASSDRSASCSASSQSQSQSTQKKTRRGRDLSWARRVVSKQNLNSQSQTVKSSGTFNSYTTPPSQR